MTHLLLASAVLAASLAAEPAKPGAAKAPAAIADKKVKGEGAKKNLKVAPPAVKDLSSPALKDAVATLLGPCAPEMAKAKVTAIEVVDAEQLNARLEKEKSQKPRAEPGQRFIDATYGVGGKKASTIRQVSSHLMLTTEQAQVLVGEKLCVILDQPL